MITILWAYQVKADQKIAEFERTYASNGPWSELFKQSKGFLDTRLIQSSLDPQRFLAIDRWKTIHDYETLDKQREELAESESRLGIFGAVFKDEE